MCVVFTRKPPQPGDPPVGVAATVKVTAVVPAVSEGEVGFKVTQAGSLAKVVSTVNGVPPVAADVTETV